MRVADPFALKEKLWPDVEFYREQEDMIRSVWFNDETFVYAGNQLGKDFTAAFIALVFFLTRTPVRVVTTSAKEDHLRVLWGEIGRFIDRARVPLSVEYGGPLIVNHQDIRKVVNGTKCKISYLIGLVASQDKLAAMQGHHATPDDVEAANDGVPRTLFISDESSSVPDGYYTMAKTWAKRTFVFGNCWPCENFFKHARKGKPGTNDRGGDIERPSKVGFYRKLLKIRAQDSPNVRLGIAEEQAKLDPSNYIVIPGVKSYADYRKDRIMLDKHQQSVVLDAEFYEGSELKFFPPEWLLLAQQHAEKLRGQKRVAKAVGIDPGEGLANTSLTAVDELGIIEQLNERTPDTNHGFGLMLDFIRKHNVTPDKVVLDRGGGGKEHADRMRAKGMKVRTVGFGEPITLDPKRGIRLVEQRMDRKEEKYAYKNRRAEMFFEFRQLIDPSLGVDFGIPRECVDLISQLEKIPLWYDDEGKVILPSKNRKPGEEVNENKPTLTELIGRSPDECDSAVLAVHGMLHKGARMAAGAV